MPFPQDIIPSNYPTGGDGTTVQSEQIIADASNIWSGTNPLYTVGGFLGRFPQFGGVSVTATGDTTASSYQLTGMSSVVGISTGAMAVGAGIPDGATVTAVDAVNLTVTLSAQAMSTAAAVIFTFYPLMMPLTMLQVYVVLANAGVLQGRYQDSWQLCMDLFVAHFCTLYMQAALPGASGSAKAVIEAGRAMGLRTAKSFGEASTSVDFSAVANDLEGWAQWKLTIYGQQFASIGRLAGKGGMLIW